MTVTLVSKRDFDGKFDIVEYDENTRVMTYVQAQCEGRTVGEARLWHGTQEPWEETGPIEAHDKEGHLIGILIGGLPAIWVKDDGTKHPGYGETPSGEESFFKALGKTGKPLAFAFKSINKFIKRKS